MRGAKPKFQFDDIKPGEVKEFPDTETSNLNHAVKRFLNRNKLPWKFKCYQSADSIHVKRIY